MPDWTAFWAVAGFVLLLVLGLAWLTSGRLAGSGRRASRHRSSAERSIEEVPSREDELSSDERRSTEDRTRPDDGKLGTSIDESPDADVDGSVGAIAVAHDQPDGPGPRGEPTVASIPTGALLANVVATHGGLGLLVLGAAALTGIPAADLGVEGTAWSTGALAVVGGLVLGVSLAAANAALAASLERVGVDHNEALRAALAPESMPGWAVLLLVILPLVAAFEELLFRAVLIGAATAATGLSPWLFVVCSSVAFALGHGVQGRGGILVTGLLGGVLGVAFVLTNSLLLVAIAHYVVNAVEFLLKEWLGLELDGRG